MTPHVDREGNEWVANSLTDARAGNETALGLIFEHYRAYLTLVASEELPAEVRPKVAASDVVQQTFLEARRHFSQFQGDREAQLRGWLRRMLLNNVVDVTRHYSVSQKRCASREVALDGDNSAIHTEELLADRHDTPATRALTQERANLVQGAIARLDEDYRLVVQLRNFELLDFEEIGLRMNRSTNAVKKLWALISAHQALANGHSTHPPDSVTDDTSDDLRLELECLEDLELLRRFQASVSDSNQHALAPAEMADSQTLGRFRIESELGRGGCGVVFLAYDPQLGRRVALKVPRPDVLFSPEMKARFVKEGRTAAVLSHPGIIAVFEAGEVGGVCYIASEYCSGPTLSTWLAGLRHDVPQVLAATVVADLADAVDHAHRHNILHRDLKPGNVLLAPDESANSEFPFRAKLADFGLAKLMEEQDAGEQATRTGAFLGTPAYMSPEQANGRTREIGTHSDVYALGVTLYELLTRRPPFLGGSDVETLRRIVERDPTRLSVTRKSISRDLEAICLKCLEKNPAKRYSSASELAADLRRFLAGEPTHARPTSLPVRAWKWTRRNQTLAGFMAFIVLAILTAAAGLTTYSIKQKQFNTELSLALETADQARLRAEESGLQLQRRLYAADMKLAGQALAENDVRQVRTFLARHVPQSGEHDLRDFVWHYLSRHISQQPLTEFKHPGGVYSAEYSPNGQRLATACADGLVRLWDPNAPKQPVIEIDTGHGECNCASFDHAGRRLATTGDDRAIRIWDVETHSLLQTIKDAHEGMGYDVLFTNDGEHVVSCGEDPHVRMWDIASGELVRDWENHPDHICDALAHLPESNMIASVGTDAWLVLLNPTEDSAAPEVARRQLNYADLHPELRGLAYTPEGIVSVNAVGSLYKYLIDSDKVIEFHKLFRDEPRAVAVNHDGLIVVADDVGNLTRLRVAGENVHDLRSFKAHATRVWSLTFHPEGDRFVSC
ncbi:Probable serine/threonine-protein kinase SCO3848, partial [Durusdinium trenchii]